MNLRFIEAQNARKAELKRLADIKEKQLKEALEASKKLASMQRDSERQWIVSTPITTDAVYETLFGNLTPTVHIHPISGETIRRPTAPYSSEPIRGNTEGYTHFDVQWTTTLPPFPRQANSHDIEQFRNIVFGSNPCSEISLPNNIRETVTNIPVNNNTGYRNVPMTFGTASNNTNHNEFFRYYNNLISNTITNSIAVHTARRNEPNIPMILNNISNYMENLIRNNILYSYSTYNHEDIIRLTWRYTINGVEFAEQRLLLL